MRHLNNGRRYASPGFAASVAREAMVGETQARSFLQN